nr:isoleucine--tRNA ligase, cytoplasmic [Tanacetum cinerariifolium]
STISNFKFLVILQPAAKHGQMILVVRHKIDHIKIPSPRGPEFGVLQGVEVVFDCWFESGSMSYAYIHFPFETKEFFSDNFPRLFVARGFRSTRGW